MKIAAIVAMDKNRVIGQNGTLPWHLPADLKRFKELTTGFSVVMGRNTYFSLPDKFRPLPNRNNIVVTSDPTKLKDEGVETFKTPEAAIEACKQRGEDKVWIIGGSQLYASTVDLWDELHLTLVKAEHEGDAYFPNFEDRLELVESEEQEGCIFQIYHSVKS